MAINNVTISGNLTRDAEVRTTKNGNTVVSLSVAVNERTKDASGNWTDYANFFDCTMYGAYAAKVSDSLRKGTKVVISGKLHQSRWERNGENKSLVEIIGNEIELPRREQGASGQQHAPIVLDADIPF